jgi:hypothetical protein
MSRRLVLLPGRLAVCRLGPAEALPAWLPGHGFTSVTRTGRELSVICAETAVPASAQHVAGWRCLALEGPFELAMTGVLAPLATALAEARVSMLPVGTFDTDHLLVRQVDLARAIAALARIGCVIEEETA